MIDCPMTTPYLAFPEDTKLTLDAVHHRCDPKQGPEKTFIYVEYLLKVDGIMWTIETAPIDDDYVTDIRKEMTLIDFISRWPEYRLYPRTGHYSNISEKTLDNDSEIGNNTDV